MDELLQDFLTESSEQLEALDAQLVRFEREPSDARIIANIYRLVHVIKSACGFLHLQRLEKVANGAEMLIIRLRDRAEPDGETVALTLATIDRIKLILHALGQDRGEPPGDDDRLIAEIEGASEPRPDSSACTVPNTASVLGDVLGPGPSPAERRADSVRVSLDALERLNALVSELVLTRNQLVAAGAENEEGLRAPLRRLSAVTAELGSGVRTARMFPVTKLFANLHRLMRGLSAETGKKVELSLRGGETEIDRQLIEAIRDPLTRVMQNAVVHGIEPPEERRRVGKPEMGVIEVSARLEAGLVCIDVADDGRGFDFDAIRERSFAAGPGSRDEIAALSEVDLCRFMFAPGSGETPRPAGVSNRSPGLEIVRANLDRVGGSASLRNRPGRGATIGLQIPLAAATAPVFIVRAGSERFALLRRFVDEVVKLDLEGGALVDVQGALALVTADGAFPAGNLQVLMGSPHGPRHREAPRIALKINADQGSFALAVDEIIDVQDVVLKSLPTPLRRIPTFSAAVLLGDGGVVLALDPSGLARTLGLPKSGAPRVRPTKVEARPSRTAFVVFRSDGTALRALPASVVAKILQLTPDRIEFAKGDPIINENEQQIPLVDIEGRRPVDLRSGSMTALLLRSGDLSVGLIVGDVVDVVELGGDLADSGRTELGLTIRGGEAIEVLDPMIFFRLPEISPPPRAAAAAEDVLILEPTAFFQRMIAGALDRNGYPARVAGDLAAALALDPERRCAAALVDIDLAIAHRDQITRHLRDSAGRAPVLIGLASHGGPAARGKARKAGLATAVGKFDRAAMLTALRDALRETEIAA